MTTATYGEPLDAVATPLDVVSNPELFAAKFLKIRNKEKQLVPLKWNRAQRHFHQNRTERDLILKARQMGFSTYVQGEQFRRSVTKTSTSITLAHDSDTTQKLRRMADRFWEHCQFNGIRPRRQYANAALATYPELDSASIIGTAGGTQKGRGDTYTDFHGSEVAFWPDAEKILTGAMQGGNPDVVLESTPNGAQGHFYDLCMEALSGDSVWTLHFYTWWWDEGYAIELVDGEVIEFTYDEVTASRKAETDGFGGLTPEQIKWRRWKKKELRDKFEQEYPEDAIGCFLTSGNSYFGDTSENFKAPFNATYDPTHTYSGGMDFAQTNDYLVFSISDRTMNCQVAQLRVNNLSWKELRRRVYKLYCQWSGESVYQKDKAILDMQENELPIWEYEEQLKELQLQRKAEEFVTVAEKNSIGVPNIEALIEMGMPLDMFNTTNESKAEIMSEQYEALHTNDYQLLNIPATKHEYNIFVATQLPSGAWRLAAAGDGHDDTVIATALDLYASTNSMTVRMAVAG